MGELASVIFATAALVTAIGGAVAAVVSALRTGARERRQAADDAVSGMVGADTATATVRIAELETELKRLREGRS